MRGTSKTGKGREKWKGWTGRVQGKEVERGGNRGNEHEWRMREVSEEGWGRDSMTRMDRKD